MEISRVEVGRRGVDLLEGAGLHDLKVYLVAFFFGQEALLGGVEVAVRLKLVIHKLRSSGAAKGAFHLGPFGSVLLVVLLEAAEANEVGALAAGQNVVERQRANGTAVHFGLTCHLGA